MKFPMVLDMNRFVAYKTKKKDVRAKSSSSSKQSFGNVGMFECVKCAACIENDGSENHDELVGEDGEGEEEEEEV